APRPGGGGVVQGDDHADAPAVVLRGGLAQGLDAGVLGGHVEVERGEVLGHAGPGTLDELLLGDGKARPAVCGVDGRTGDVVPVRAVHVARGVAVEIQVDDVVGGGVAVELEGLRQVVGAAADQPQVTGVQHLAAFEHLHGQAGPGGR